MTIDIFQHHRPRLFALAYRLLGSRGDAEDVVQDAWLRWSQAERDAVRDPEAWLVTATTRLGIDRLRRLRHERDAYPGPWLPEPVDVDASATPEAGAEIADQVSLAFLALLERLGPEERAAFLLKEAFDHDYEQIAALLGHSVANCRQMVHRARGRLQAGRPRFEVHRDRHRELLTRFMQAAQTGDESAIVRLLDANARLVSDGGGKVTAAIRPLFGAERIGRLYAAVARRVGQEIHATIGTVNGEPAIIRTREGRLESVTTITLREGRIDGIFTVLNPVKLRHWRAN
ncbi:RNA polymerase sigma-70 factor [Marilutibacter aestuarii]|uniref:RNA polymerase sigma-70 factor n=1 Tax=Marilutibacter aestuarii TaxID=1706195 RepID=A0A508A3D1_9GAMM|nr:RNA polymerase sigma-70 factor [Lysobacter aestuarii]TQD44429.1 RNA polymerase sigma-70 factor [Lysobacter aestuarii]